MRKFLGRAILGLAILSSISAACRAQEWPSKPVKLIIPFAVGGHSDQVARAALSRREEVGRKMVGAAPRHPRTLLRERVVERIESRRAGPDQCDQ